MQKDVIQIYFDDQSNQVRINSDSYFMGRPVDLRLEIASFTDEKSPPDLGNLILSMLRSWNEEKFSAFLGQSSAEIPISEELDLVRILALRSRRLGTNAYFQIIEDLLSNHPAGNEAAWSDIREIWGSIRTKIEMASDKGA